MRILLVEDSRQLSDWLAKALRKDHYVVDCVYDGEDADHALKTQPYALVILDLSLPGMGGMEVLRRLRARGATVPVLILTANASVPAASPASTAARTIILPSPSTSVSWKRVSGRSSGVPEIRRIRWSSWAR
jgi:Response regulators consisting of a CheY-like receiver domain and a winged-helix DNA-binding domain